MNEYKKYCPNVFLAKCEQEYQKNDIITIVTKYGKENKHKIHNLIGKNESFFYYSITRADGFNNQARAKNKIEKLNSWAESAERRSNEYQESSNEGREFLSLGEPIKIGHHSEKRHRALIDRNYDRMDKSIKEQKKAEAYKDKIAYWQSISYKFDLSMPESIKFFKFKLAEAKEKHQGLKNGTIKREHSFSLTYAKKEVNELEKKYKIAIELWS